MAAAQEGGGDDASKAKMKDDAVKEVEEDEEMDEYI
jgi:hypothetical protein